MVYMTLVMVVALVVVALLILVVALVVGVVMVELVVAFVVTAAGGRVGDGIDAFFAQTVVVVALVEYGGGLGCGSGLGQVRWWPWL